MLGQDGLYYWKRKIEEEVEGRAFSTSGVSTTAVKDMDIETLKEELKGWEWAQWCLKDETAPNTEEATTLSMIRLQESHDAIHRCVFSIHKTVVQLRSSNLPSVNYVVTWFVAQ